jgi:excisionase family DNA binding protein
MENISFDELPSKIGEILMYIKSLKEKIDNLEINEKSKYKYTLSEAADFLNLKQKTIYNLIHNNEIAYCKPSKKIYFLHEDLMIYIKNSRCQSRY